MAKVLRVVSSSKSQVREEKQKVANSVKPLRVVQGIGKIVGKVELVEKPALRKVSLSQNKVSEERSHGLQSQGKPFLVKSGLQVVQAIKKDYVLGQSEMPAFLPDSSNQETSLQKTMKIVKIVNRVPADEGEATLNTVNLSSSSLGDGYLTKKIKEGDAVTDQRRSQRTLSPKRRFPDSFSISDLENDRKVAKVEPRAYFTNNRTISLDEIDAEGKESPIVSESKRERSTTPNPLPSRSHVKDSPPEEQNSRSGRGFSFYQPKAENSPERPRPESDLGRDQSRSPSPRKPSSLDPEHLLKDHSDVRYKVAPLRHSRSPSPKMREDRRHGLASKHKADAYSSDEDKYLRSSKRSYRSSPSPVRDDRRRRIDDRYSRETRLQSRYDRDERDRRDTRNEAYEGRYSERSRKRYYSDSDHERNDYGRIRDRNAIDERRDSYHYRDDRKIRDKRSNRSELYERDIGRSSVHRYERDERDRRDESPSRHRGRYRDDDHFSTDDRYSRRSDVSRRKYPSDRDTEYYNSERRRTVSQREDHHFNDSQKRRRVDDIRSSRWESSDRRHTPAYDSSENHYSRSFKDEISDSKRKNPSHGNTESGRRQEVRSKTESGTSPIESGTIPSSTSRDETTPSVLSSAEMSNDTTNKPKSNTQKEITHSKPVSFSGTTTTTTTTTIPALSAASTKSSTPTQPTQKPEARPVKPSTLPSNDPTFDQIHHALQRISDQAFEEAISIMEKELPQHERVMSSSLRYRVYYKIARAYLKVERHKEVETYVGKALALKKSASLYMYRARSRLKRKDFDGAKQDVSAALDVADTNTQVLDSIVELRKEILEREGKEGKR